MPTTNRPDDTRCPFGDDGYLLCETGADGICRYCGLGTCAACEAPVEPASAVRTPGCLEVLCAECAADSDGVPEVVEEEETKQERTLTDAELLDLREAV